jgi:UPF0755 protein
MSPPSGRKIKYQFYEYPLYWLVTAILFILALPVLLIKFAGFLVESTGAPMKSVRNFLGFILVLITVAGGFVAYKIFIPYDIGSERRSVMINENDNFATVLKNLDEAGVLKSDYIFKTMAVLTGVDKKLSPGRYDFVGKLSLYDILRKLKNRDIATLMVTIPEGLNIYKTAGLMAARLNIDSARFLARTADTSYTEEAYHLDGLEGYLFPETYRLWYGIRIDQIINIMLTEFHHKSSGLFDSLPTDSYSPKQIIVLASIIEAEARADDEKPLISSVYHNRLKRKMKLQADPTVIYALGGLDRPLYYKDLEYDSPYNTYKYTGLPPGPINSPGLASIKAAIYPAETNYLYFVADGAGRHIFSRTLVEHNRAKRKIKRNKKLSGQ